MGASVWWGGSRGSVVFSQEGKRERVEMDGWSGGVLRVEGGGTDQVVLCVYWGLCAMVALVCVDSYLILLHVVTLGPDASGRTDIEVGLGT